jgi:hypothetical protein
MIDPNEAPDGYIAVPWYDTEHAGCAACAFSGERIAECIEVLCCENNRKDRTSVYFVPVGEAPQTYTPINFSPGCGTCVFVRSPSCRKCPCYN